MPKRKNRKIDFVPDHHEFGTGRKKSVLTLSELEAMRLLDYEGMSQVEAAEQMDVSRATIQRLLQTGRKKLISSVMFKEKIILKAEENTEAGTMKLAFINENGMIGGHLGHAKKITLFDFDSEKYIDFEPEVTGGKARAKWLFDAGVTGLVVNSIGDKAFKHLTSLGIRVLDGTEMSIEDALIAYTSTILQNIDPSKIESKENHECECEEPEEHECCGGHLEEDHECCGGHHEEEHECCGGHGHHEHQHGKCCE